jgi:hypothetical protein
MREKRFWVAVVWLVGLLVLLVINVAQATAYRKTGMTTAVASDDKKNPNEQWLARGVTTGLWTCQDSFSVAAGDTYHFVPWYRVNGTLRAMQAWRYQVLPTQGACRVTVYQHGAALSDTLTNNCGPDSAFTNISDGSRIDSLVIRGLVLCKGRVRAQ